MAPTIDIITLGVKDVERARQFYERAFGGIVRGEPEAPLVGFGDSASPLALRPWDTIAAEAGIPAESEGFRAFTLSFIVDSPDAVDALLASAEGEGGRVSKPPRNAVWGYSAYVTDPDGHLWKVASSKRRPLIGKKSPDAERPVVTAKELPITIGVADMKRSKAFYKNGLGLPVKKAFGNKFVMFSGQDIHSDLGMYKREALADDAAVAPAGTGFHGFSITHLADSRGQVDELLARADQAGGKVIKPGAASGGTGYSGTFSDLDGNLWQVACRS
jgi:catechol 2,3-dioxygenase-like lactoylglutathione lyase family enzyme